MKKKIKMKLTWRAQMQRHDKPKVQLREPYSGRRDNSMLAPCSLSINHQLAILLKPT